MNKRVMLVIVVLVMALSLCGCCSHEWYEATCTEPETCALCDKTQGEALGHEDAEYEDWSIDEEELVYYRVKWCNRCEDFYDREDGEAITSFVENGVLLISPDGFSKRFDDSVMNQYKFNSEEIYSDSMLFYDENNTVFYEIQNEEDDYCRLGMYSFTKEDGNSVPISESYSESIAIGINILIEDSWDVTAVTFATVQAIDPALDYNEAGDLTEQLLDNVGNMDGISKNNVRYTLYKDSSYHYLLVTAL